MSTSCFHITGASTLRGKYRAVPGRASADFPRGSCAATLYPTLERVRLKRLERGEKRPDLAVVKGATQAVLKRSRFIIPDQPGLVWTTSLYLAAARPAGRRPRTESVRLGLGPGCSLQFDARVKAHRRLLAVRTDREVPFVPGGAYHLEAPAWGWVAATPSAALTSRLEQAAEALPQEPAADELACTAVDAAGFVPLGAGARPDCPGAVPVGDWLVRGDKLRAQEETATRLASRFGGAAQGAVVAAMALPAACAEAVVTRLVERRTLRRAGNHLVTDAAGTGLPPIAQGVLRRLDEAGTTGVDLQAERDQAVIETVQALARVGRAVVAGGRIAYAAPVYRKITRRVLDGLPPGAELTVGHAKERTGYSRKLVIPLLEQMTEDGVLRRREDAHIVAGGSRRGRTA